MIGFNRRAQRPADDMDTVASGERKMETNMSPRFLALSNRKHREELKKSICHMLKFVVSIRYLCRNTK